MAEKLNTGGVEAELAPDVSMVYDESRKDFCLASRYLNDNKKDRYIGLTMGELISAQGGERSRKNNSFVFKGDADINQLQIGGEPLNVVIGKEEEPRELNLNKQEFYDAVATSIKLGDHDLNPDNFYVIYDKETDKTHIGSIDMGHAFNDLIKNWGRLSDHSPNKESDRGFVLDTLNRDKINGAKSKFLRYYGDGITLDKDFATALRDSSADYSKAIEECKKELKALIRVNPKVKKEVMDSLKTLGNRSGSHLVINEEVAKEEEGLGFLQRFKTSLRKF